MRPGLELPKLRNFYGSPNFPPLRSQDLQSVALNTLDFGSKITRECDPK
jgi:hypothetical protein